MVSSDGGDLFVWGSTAPRLSEVVKLSAVDGAVRWKATIVGELADMALAPRSRRLYLTGAVGERKFEDYLTVSLQTRDGAQRWRDRYPWESEDEDHSWDEAYGLAVAPGGRLIAVTGLADSGAWNDWGETTTARIGTIFYDAATGERARILRLTGGAGASWGVATEPAPSGNKVYVVGLEGTQSSSAEPYCATTYGICRFRLRSFSA